MFHDKHQWLAFFGRRNNSPLSVTNNKYIHYNKTAEKRNMNEPHHRICLEFLCFFLQPTSLYPLAEV
jgi:hypothetical protein